MKARYTIPGLLALALALASIGLWGCSSRGGRPTITMDAEGFVAAYMAERDEFRDRTYPARVKCAKTVSDPNATAQVKADCATLAAKAATWAGYDKVILNALLTRSPIDGASIQAATDAAKAALALALQIAPLLGAL